MKMDRNRLVQMERKRQRAIEKNEKSRKCREVSQRNKGPPIQPEASRGDEKVKFLIVVISRVVDM
jgi:hypothetical protein